MSDIVNTATIKVVADASGVEAGLRPVDEAVARTGKNLENLGATAKTTGKTIEEAGQGVNFRPVDDAVEKTGKGLDSLGTTAKTVGKTIEEAGRGLGLSGVGEGASTAATKVDRATKNMADSIQRAIQAQTALAAGAKGTAENYAALANVRGINVDALKPLLAQLDDARRKADLAAEAQRRLDDSTKFLADLKSRADGIGKTASQLAEMRAAQLGVADAAGPMIAKLREAEEAGEGAFGKLGDLAGKAKAGLLAIAAAAAAAGAGLAVMVNSALDDLGELDDMAQKTGASVESLSKIQKVNTVFGPGMDQISGVLNKLSKGMATVDDETNKTHKALTALGVSSKDASGKLRDPAEVLVDVAKKLQGYNDGAAKAALITDAVGKSGADLLPFLNDLAENYEKMTGVSADAASAGAGFQDQLGWMKLRVKELFTAITIDALPALNDLAGAFLDVYKNQKEVSKPDVKNWADQIGLAIAQAADAAAMLGRGITITWNSLKAVRADIDLASTMFENANPLKAGYKALTGGSPNEDIKKALAARNKIVIDANKTLEEQLSRPLPEFEKAYLARLAARGKEAAKPAGETKDLIYETGNDPAVKAAEAAAKKEEAAYAGVTAAIQAKIEENKLEVKVSQDATESQKLQIKVDQEITAGKLKLSDAHRKVVQAKLNELSLSEKELKANQAERDVAKYITDSVLARAQQSASLAVEYEMYGKTADARAIAMAGVEAETWKEKELAKLRQESKPISAEILSQLDAEAKSRAEVAQATIGQTRALQYAAQLDDQNKKFNLQYIADDKARAAAELALDSEVWEERIRNAGDGTLAQMRIQQNFNEWYANQSAKPFLDEQKKTWDGIEAAAHDTFLSIENGAKSAADRAKQALKNGLYEWLWQMALKPIYLDIRSVFTSSGSAIPGVGGTAGSASSAVNSNPLISAANAASAAYKAISGGFEGLSDMVAGGVQSAMTSMGYTPLASQGLATASGQALTPLASYAGTAAGYGAGLIGGHYIGNAIAGDYSVAHGQTVTNVASVVGAIVGGPIGGAIGGAIGGLINRAFGMGSKETQTTGISGMISGNGLTASSYAKWHQDGGWFRSDKNGTDSIAFSADTIAAITNGLNQIKGVSSSFAASLGVDASSIASYSKQFNIDLGKDGKIEDGITKLLTNVGDELATQLVPNIAQFAKTGEAAASTLERLAGDFDATTQMAQLLGKTAAEAFGTAGIASAAAREHLIDLAGSASNLTSWASSYATNFLTEEEKLAPVKKAVDAAMASLGLASVTTRDQFKQVVNSLDLTTDAGARQFTSMMQLADAFAQVHAASETLASSESSIAEERAGLQDQLDQLTMTSTQLLKKQRDALNEANRPLFDMIQTAQKLADTATNMTKFRDAAKSLNDTMLTGSLSPLTPVQQEAELHSQYEAMKAAAMAGDTKAQDGVFNALTAWLTASQKLNAGDSTYQANFAEGQRDTAAFAAWATNEVDAAQAQLDAMNSQNVALGTANTALATANTILATISQNTAPVAGGANVIGTALSVLTSAINALKQDNAKLTEQVAGLRKDQDGQTGDSMQANDDTAQRAAQAIVDGVTQGVSQAVSKLVSKESLFA